MILTQADANFLGLEDRPLAAGAAEEPAEKSSTRASFFGTVRKSTSVKACVNWLVTQWLAIFGPVLRWFCASPVASHQHAAHHLKVTPCDQITAA